MLFRKKIIWNKHRYRRSKLYSLVGLGFLIFLIGIYTMSSTSFFNSAIPVTTDVTSVEQVAPTKAMQELGKLLILLEIQEVELQEILTTVCPAISRQDSKNIENNTDFWNLLSRGITLITDINSNDARNYFQTQMAAFATIASNEAMVAAQVAHSYEEGGEEDFYLDTPDELTDWHFEIEKTPIELSKDPVILLYNTHNAETYKPTDGKSKLEGKNAGVAKVAKVFGENLEQYYGLKTIRSETIHDYPDWARSYIMSLKTVQKLLKANRTIQAVFDIHRDAGFPSKTTTTVNINGKSGAKIMMVVGTEHERWRENLAFAEKLEAKALELYPGLIRDIRIRDNRRYNQQVHPHALILEVGSDLNTLAEAQYSITLFAKVVAEVIKEN